MKRNLQGKPDRKVAGVSIIHKIMIKNPDIKAVVFDLGNVILSFKGAYTIAAGLTRRTSEEARKSFMKHDEKACRGRISCEVLWNRVLTDLGFTDNIDMGNFIEQVRRSYSPIVPTHNLIWELKDYFLIGLLTNIHTGTFAYVKDKGIVPDINYKIAIQSCDYDVVKPETKIFEIAEQSIALSPHNLLFVDDLESNVRAAVGRGWNGFRFNPDNPNESVRAIRLLL